MIGALVLSLGTGQALAQIATANTASSGPAAAGTGTSPLGQGGAEAAVQSLLENANYWRSRGNPAAALQALDRILIYKPRDPDMLATAAEVAYQAGDYEAASRLQSKLAQVAPQDSRVRLLAAARPLAPEDMTTLDRARRLARDGKNAEALAQYKILFHGQVLPQFAVEYYSVLALTTSEGFDEANQKLGQLADAAPNDLQLQLSFARLLVMQEDTRSDGIKRLRDLAHRPGVDRAARQVWREVLLWQGPSERSRTQLEEYIGDNPPDPAIQAKYSDFNAVLPDASTKALMRGYFDMSNNDNAKAEAEFAEAYKLNSRNANAAFMLGVFKRMQGREAEAQSLIAKAIALAPDRRAELIAASGGNYRVKLPQEAEDQIQISLFYATGRYAEAEQELVRLSAGKETASTYIQLGEIQFHAGKLDDALANFQKARDLNPKSGDAVCGQANVLARRGQLDKANALYSQAADLYSRAKNASGIRRVAAGRGEVLRARTSGLDATSTTRMYEAALAGDPANMALRLDYARLLRQAGRGEQAWSVVSKGLELNRKDRGATQQALDFAIQGGDRQHATKLAQQLNASATVSGIPVVARRIARR